MRLIDADALKEKRFKMHSEFLGTVSVVATKDIEDAPTIDPESLRPKGKWVHNEYYVEWAERYVCSVCNRNAPSDGDYREMLSNFCPNCGVDMRD